MFPLTLLCNNMISNLEKYKEDLNKLIADGKKLSMAMKADFSHVDYKENLKKELKDDRKVSEHLKQLPSFKRDYQTWYSEALYLLKQLLSDRIPDFKKLYEKPKNRKNDISCENYVIEDALLDFDLIGKTHWGDKVTLATPPTAIPKFEQQLSIIASVKRRFESSLFDIKQLVQADLFDSELEVARELNKKGFIRGAGAIAGVVLEKHLSQVCGNHNLIVKIKNATINDYNQLLKDSDVIETKDWRFIQHLADLRNSYVHNKEKKPKKEDIEDLLDGVGKISKTIY